MLLKKFLLLLVCLLFASSCKYQEDNLPEFSLQGLSEIESGGFKVTAPTLTPLQEELTSFYKTYVKVLPGSFDTRVDYQTLLNEKLDFIKEYNLRRDRILTLIENHPYDGISKKALIAFLINAYNFIAIDIVLNNSKEQLINSIADLGGSQSFMAFSDVDNYGYNVAGEILSLDIIEKEELADLTAGSDARLHFAVICASAGCPVLLNVPYNEKDLEAQLDFITKAGLSLKRMFSPERNKTNLSQIFSWYAQDFEKDIARTGSYSNQTDYILAFIAKFTGIQRAGLNTSLNYLNYDWTLNKF